MKTIIFDEIDSTNTYALKHFDELASGDLVLAFKQTAGRGRLGRKWESPADLNIYASWILRDIENPGFLTGMAVLHFLRQAAPKVIFFLKWPNDVYTLNGKIAGILCEGCGVKDGKIAGAAAGFGININMPEHLLSTVGQQATSLLTETGKEFNLKNLIGLLEKTLESDYISYLHNPALLFQDWKHENYLIGRAIEVVEFGGVSRSGIFEDISPAGELVFRACGEDFSRVYNCVDVKIRFEYLK